MRVLSIIHWSAVPKRIGNPIIIAFTEIQHFPPATTRQRPNNILHLGKKMPEGLKQYRKQGWAKKCGTGLFMRYLRRFPVVMIQQASQARLALNLTFHANRQRHNRSVAQRLVRTFMMIMGEVFADQVIQMAFAKHKEMTYCISQ